MASFTFLFVHCASLFSTFVLSSELNVIHFNLNMGSNNTFSKVHFLNCTLFKQPHVCNACRALALKFEGWLPGEI